MSNPFDAMTAQERDEWVDTIGHSDSGEARALQQLPDCREVHIEALMLDNGYERCVRCDWFEELSQVQQVGGEAVCNDCLEEGEEADE